MSWIAVACIAGPYVPPVYFQHCAYCTKAPDEGQKEARCTSCGGPLQEKERVDTEG